MAIFAALAVPAIVSRIGRAILAPLGTLWRYVTAEPARMVVAALIVLCGFLCWRLSSVDGDRDDWRDKVRAYEAASKAVKDADTKADAAGLATAETTKGQVDETNKRAADAARDSDDPLRDGLGSLRAKADRGSGKATD